MSFKKKRPLIGVQGSVMGWDCPWHPQFCQSHMRTGEGLWFPSQDPAPSVADFVAYLKKLGVDFYVHHVAPNATQIDAFINDFKSYGLGFLLGNEYGNINGSYAVGTNRYDVPEGCVNKARESDYFMGLLYDETEHLQLHPEQYPQSVSDLPQGQVRYQWCSPEGKSLSDVTDGVTLAVKNRLRSYGMDVPVFSEHVFPVMYHAFARGGINPCPKVLKEEVQSVQLATALGAAKQYGRRLGICVDLWGQDFGPWFTRAWKFPGHSPLEFESGLRMAYLMAPQFLFVENVDVLARNCAAGFKNSEYGDIFEEFTRKFVPENCPPYAHGQAQAEVAVIRSDDSCFKRGGGFYGRGLYGSPTLKPDYRGESVFEIFHILSSGAVPSNGLTHHLPQFQDHFRDFDRSMKSRKQFPLVYGLALAEQQTNDHGLFYPLRNVLVFDEYADDTVLGRPGLVFVTGNRVTGQALNAVGKRVKAGAICIIAAWLAPDFLRGGSGTETDWIKRDGNGLWCITEDFTSCLVRELAAPWTGSDRWSQRFGQYEVRFYPGNKDGTRLEFEISGSP